jgi:hypothetical protein
MAKSARSSGNRLRAVTLCAGIAALLGVAFRATIRDGDGRRRSRSEAVGAEAGGAEAATGSPESAVELLVVDPDGNPLAGLSVIAAARPWRREAPAATEEIDAGEGLPRSRARLALRGGAVRVFRTGAGFVDLHPGGVDVRSRGTTDARGVARLREPAATGGADLPRHVIATDDSRWYGEAIVPSGEWAPGRRIRVTCERAGVVSLRLSAGDGESLGERVPLVWWNASDDGSWSWEMRPGESIEWLVRIGTTGCVGLRSGTFLFPSTQPPIAVRDDRTEVLLTVQPSPVLRVVDDASGAAISPFRLLALDLSTGVGLGWLSGVHSNAAGSVVLGHPSLTGDRLRRMRLRLFVLADGYEPESAILRFDEPQPVREVRMRRGGGRSLSGVVRSSSIDRKGLSIQVYPFRVLPRGLVGPLAQFDRAEMVASTATDEVGGFQVPGVIAGDLTLLVLRGSNLLRSVRIPASESSVAIDLEACEEVSGRALWDDGSPAAGARIVLERGDGASRTAAADEAGRFRFPLVPFGDYEIGAASGDSPVPLAVRDHGPVEVVVKVPRGVRRPVRVVIEGETSEPATLRLGSEPSVTCDVPGSVVLNGCERDSLGYRTAGGRNGRRALSSEEWTLGRVVLRLGSDLDVEVGFSDEERSPVQVTPLACEFRREGGATEQVDLDPAEAERIRLSMPADTDEATLEVRLGPGDEGGAARVRIPRAAIGRGACECVLPREPRDLRLGRPGGGLAVVRVLGPDGAPMPPGAMVHGEWLWDSGSCVVVVDLGSATVRGAETTFVVPRRGTFRVTGFHRESQIRTVSLFGEAERRLDGATDPPLVLDLTLRPR